MAGLILAAAPLLQGIDLRIAPPTVVKRDLGRFRSLGLQVRQKQQIASLWLTSHGVAGPAISHLGAVGSSLADRHVIEVSGCRDHPPSTGARQRRLIVGATLCLV